MLGFPPQTPARPEDIYALAYGAACELARIYETLAQEMTSDRAETKHIFAALADWERSRLHRLSEKSYGASNACRAFTLISADEYAELAHSALTSPFRALSAAVTHCDRAFVAWAYVIATLEDAPARAVAETLATEALERANVLRKERRRAWRAERGSAMTRDALRASQKERRLLAELRRMAPAGKSVDSSARAAGYAEELSNLYIDAITRARDAVSAARAQRRAKLSLQRLRDLRGIGK